MSTLSRYIAQGLRSQSEQTLRRRAPDIRHLAGLEYEVDGKRSLSFCSNDFLGFAAEPASSDEGNLSQRAGSGASRLVHGNHQSLRELENQFAQTLGFDDAVLLPSGFQANLAGLAQLPTPPESLIFSDASNHASIIDALRLNKNSRKIQGHLEQPAPGPNWWVLESRYSMDGDAPTVEQLTKHQAGQGMIYLDEAHRFGLEPRGMGLAQQLSQRPHLANYPLGKAFGMQGAILAGEQNCMDWIRQFSRAYIYTTAPSPVVCEQISRRFMELIGEGGEKRRAELNRNIQTAAYAFPCKVQGPIISLPIGNNESTMKASESLLNEGFHVQAIRPPTVPKGTARLRITLSSLHTTDEILRLGKLLTANQPNHTS